MSSADQNTILIVEDDDCLRRLLSMALTTKGYPVATTATLHEAEAAKEQLGLGTFGLVITDVHLSNDPRVFEGVDLFEGWTAARPTLPFLLISGNVSNHTLPAVRTGAVRFLSKPFELHELLAVVKNLLERSLPTADHRDGPPTPQGRA